MVVITSRNINRHIRHLFKGHENCREVERQPPQQLVPDQTRPYFFYPDLEKEIFKIVDKYSFCQTKFNLSDIYGNGILHNDNSDLCTLDWRVRMREIDDVIELRKQDLVDVHPDLQEAWATQYLNKSGLSKGGVGPTHQTSQEIINVWRKIYPILNKFNTQFPNFSHQEYLDASVELNKLEEELKQAGWNKGIN